MVNGIVSAENKRDPANALIIPTESYTRCYNLHNIFITIPIINYVNFFKSKLNKQQNWGELFASSFPLKNHIYDIISCSFTHKYPLR